MITAQHIEDQIASEAYYVFPGTTATVCLLTLKRGGFHVAGFAQEPGDLGMRLARANAKGKIWSHEAYLAAGNVA